MVIINRCRWYFFLVLPVLTGFLRGIGQNHVLLKPVPHPNGPREVMFYKKVFKSHFSDDSEDMKVLKELIPEYYGSHDLVDRAGEMRILIGVSFRIFCIGVGQTSILKIIWGGTAFFPSICASFTEFFVC